ncbi:hypothetical protein P5V15_002258, partial [Pogonomyrmex californicus]
MATFGDTKRECNRGRVETRFSLDSVKAMLSTGTGDFADNKLPLALFGGSLVRSFRDLREIDEEFIECNRGREARNSAPRPNSDEYRDRRIIRPRYLASLMAMWRKTGGDVGGAEETLRGRANVLGVVAAKSCSSEESRAGGGDPGKLGVKKSRLKACSPNRQGPQQCQVCGKVFNNASALTKHKLTHSDERKYVCTMCGKAFKRQDH